MAPSTTATGENGGSQALCFERLRALGLDKRDKPQHAKLRRASVLVLLFNGPDGKIHTYITKRSMSLRSHPGESCFPGGSQDKEDEDDDVTTALREAEEETGLQPDHVEVLGRLSSLESAGHICVTSIIAKLKDSVVYDHFIRDYAWKINSDEVDDAFGVPLAFFLENPESIFELEWSGEPFFMRVYDYFDKDSGKKFFVTGLTAHIAHEVASVAYAVQQQKAVDVDEAPNTSTLVNVKGDSVSSYLWKREVSSREREYWTKRYYVYSDSSEMTPFLHQYDSDEQANRKSLSANKKNRLPLRDCTVSPSATSSTVDGATRYEFVISAVAGRIQWHMAAFSEEEREKWVKALTHSTAPSERSA